MVLPSDDMFSIKLIHPNHLKYPYLTGLFSSSRSQEATLTLPSGGSGCSVCPAWRQKTPCLRPESPACGSSAGGGRSLECCLLRHTRGRPLPRAGRFSEALQLNRAHGWDRAGGSCIAQRSFCAPG
jgi:hypothetical protein